MRRQFANIGGLINEDGTPLYPQATLFISPEELAFWTSTSSQEHYPHLAASGLFSLITSVLQAYEGSVKAVTATGEVIPGVHLVPLHGHTPGHSGIEITDGDQRLFIWGDVIHSALLQLRYPQWSIGFDMNPPQALATRVQLLVRLATEYTLVAGPHVMGLGKIRDCCEGEYTLHQHNPT